MESKLRPTIPVAVNIKRWESIRRRELTEINHSAIYILLHEPLRRSTQLIFGRRTR
jgi:hypothetical protein